jgi:hypothetical protein
MNYVAGFISKPMRRFCAPAADSPARPTYPHAFLAWAFAGGLPLSGSTHLQTPRRWGGRRGRGGLGGLTFRDELGGAGASEYVCVHHVGDLGRPCQAEKYLAEQARCTLWRTSTDCAAASTVGTSAVLGALVPSRVHR